MPISVSCAKCNRTYRLRDELAGKTAKCPCGQTMTIPAAAATVAPVKPATVAAPSGPRPAVVPTAAVSATASPPGPAAPGDLFGQLDAELSSQPAPLQPLAKSKKRPGRKKGNPYLIPAIAGGAVVAVLIVALLVAVLSSGDSSTVASATVPSSAPPSTPAPAAPPPAAPPAPPPAPKIRWNSPQEVFDASKKALAAKDWNTYLDTFTPQSQRKVVCCAAAQAGIMALQNARIHRFCDEYGIVPFNPMRLAGLPPMNPGDQKGLVRKEMQKLEGKIEDERGCFCSFMELVYDTNAPDPHGLLAAVRAAIDAEINAPLVDLMQIDDKFVGTRIMDAVGISERQPIHFLKIDGEWRMEETSLL